ncbi:MAG: hypothetical protein EOP84_02150, partial [Verrucomicrobiaceae bacterium]
MSRMNRQMYQRGVVAVQSERSSRKSAGALLLLFIYLNTALSGCLGETPRESATQSRALKTRAAELVAPAPGQILPTETDATGLAAGSVAGGAGVSMTGAATYALPLWTPPARAGIGPSLSLVYNSQAGVGAAGFGWDLAGLSKITRCGKSLALDGIEADPTLDDGPGGDRYCLDGQRLIVVGGSYGTEGAEYRTEFNGHEKIVALGVSEMGPSMFKVYQTNGTVRTYGPISPGFKTKVEYIPQTNTYVRSVVKYVKFEWDLTRVEDTMGNYMSIDYSIQGSSQSGSEILPVRVRYTGSSGAASLDPTRRVEFVFEPDPFVTDRWVAGYKMRRSQRIESVKVYGPAPESEGLLKVYRFKYRTGYHAREAASLLVSVSECDGAGVCMEDVVFDYDIPPQKIRSKTVKFTFPTVSGRAQCYFGDLDGDGRDDVLYKENDNRYHHRLSVGTTFGSSTLTQGLPSIGSVAHPDPIQPPVDSIAGESSPLFDLDGDRRAELMLTKYSWYQVAGEGGNPPELRASSGNFLYRNVKDSQRPGRVEFFLEYQEPLAEPREMQEWRVADLDGDELPEYVAYSPSQQGIVYRTYTPTGFGPLTLLRSWQPESPRHGFKIFQLGRERGAGYGDGRFATLPLAGAAGVEGGYVGRRAVEDYLNPADINGDGLQDYAITHPTTPGRGTTCYAINTGNGYEEPVCPSFVGNLSTSNVLHAADLNADGRDELYEVYPGSTYAAMYALSQTGSEWTDWVMQPPERAAVYPFATGRSFSNVADVNGDGVPDPYYCGTSSVEVDVSTGSMQPLLVTVHNGAAFASFGYGHTGDRDVYTPTESLLPVAGEIPMHRGIWVVKRAVVGIGTSIEQIRIYRYSGSRVGKGRGWLGFMERTVTDHPAGTTTTTGFLSGAPGHAALPASEIVETPMGAVTRVTKRSWTYLFRPGPGAKLSKLMSSSEDCERENVQAVMSCFQASLAEQEFDAYGNPISSVWRVLWGWEYRKSWVQELDYAYESPNVSKWLVSRLSRVDGVWSGSQGPMVSRSIKYLTHADTGLVEQITRSPESPGISEKLITEFDYNSWGLPISVEVSDLTGAVRRQTFGYDQPDVPFASWSEEGGFRMESTYHRGLGTLMHMRNGLGVDTTFSYDGLGRERKVDRVGLGDQSTSYQRRSGGGAVTVVSMGGGQTVRAESDALGRQVLEQWIRGGPQPEPVYVKTEYKSDGRIWRISQPHTASETPRYTYLDVDALGRPTRLTRIDGKTRTWTYAPLQIDTVDEMERHTRSVLDGLGNVASTSSVLPGDVLRTTAFEYGNLGELRKVRDAKGNLTSLEYDSLGRQSALVDGDQGRTEVTFNAFDEVVTRTDALGMTTIHRDGFGRPVLTTSPDGDTVYTWNGSAALRGRGQLASSVSPDGVRTEYDYDELGRPLETTWVVEGRRFATTVSYDDFGRPLSLSYPEVGPAGNLSRLTIQKTYDGAGNLSSLQNALTGVDYWKVLERNSLGQVPREAMGNGVVTQRVFDSAGTLRFLEATGVVPVQKMSFGFEPNGN